MVDSSRRRCLGCLEFIFTTLTVCELVVVESVGELYLWCLSQDIKQSYLACKDNCQGWEDHIMILSYDLLQQNSEHE